MEVKIIFGKRLKQARQREGLSLDDLSQRTGSAVSKQTISKYEKGMAMAGCEILEKLAYALNVTIEYFFRPFSFDVNEVEISFRKKACVSAKEELALKSKIQDKVERYLELEKILSLDTPACTTTWLQNINSVWQMIMLARNIRKEWGIGHAPIENAGAELMHHGVKLFEVDGPDGFDGVSGAANENTWIIVLNKNKTHVERYRLTAFHEYGHLLANKYFAPDLSKKEKEDLCTAFASEMLLPSQVLKDAIGNKSKIPFQEIIALQMRYGISVDGIMYSLKRLGIISDKRHRSFCIRKNMDPAFKHAVEESRFKEKEYEQQSDTERYNLMVYSALAQELITPARAAEFLECSIEEVENKSIAI